MIHKYKKGDDVKVGQYANFESIFIDGLCSRGGLITKVSGNRVYFFDARDEEERFKSKGSIVFLSDTLEENQFLFQCSQEQMTATRIMERYVKDAIMERVLAR
jgi:hypothetical protein